MEGEVAGEKVASAISEQYSDYGTNDRARADSN
jgi:hypothetical protein